MADDLFPPPSAEESQMVHPNNGRSLKQEDYIAGLAKGLAILDCFDSGQVRLSPELVDYRFYPLHELKCWPAGTGYALADWLRSRGHEPVFFTEEENAERRRGLDAPAKS